MTNGEEQDQLRGFDPRPMFKELTHLPVGEGSFLAGGEAEDVLGRMIACYLGIRVGAGDMFFEGVTVIAPPRLAWDVSDEAIQKMLVDGVMAIWEEVSAKVAENILGRVHIHRCRRLESEEVIVALRAAGSKRVCMIPEASRYRDGEESDVREVGLSRTVLIEEIWVPHAVRMATASLAVAKENDSVLVFHSTELVLRQESRQLLSDVDQLYSGFLVDAEGKGPNEELLTRMIPRWVAMSMTGRLQVVLQELEGAGLSSDAQREVRLHIATRTRNHEQVLHLLREYLDHLEELTADSVVSLGRIAFRFGDAELARKFFSDSVGKSTNHMGLVLVLDAATSMGDEGLVHNTWERLRMLFPNEKYLGENRERRVVLTCEVARGGAPLAPSRAGFEESHEFLANALYKQLEVDYDALFARIRTTWPEKERLAALCIALHALSCRSLEAALTYAVMAAEEAAYGERACWVLLDVLRKMFLQEVRPKDGMDIYKVPLLFISQHLADRPEEGRMRAELAQVLGVESTGSIGLEVLASFALDVVGSGATKALRSPVSERSTDERLKDFFSRALSWMSEQPVVELGVTRLPAELVIDDPNLLIAGIEACLRISARMDEASHDLDMLEKLAYLMCLLQPYAPGNNTDLSMLRLLAAKFWYHGRAQRARDVAEQLLKLAGGDPQRRRIAWGSYADVLHRTGSLVDALIGLVCAAKTGAQLAAANLYQEAYVLLRCARDLHFYDVARSVLRTCKRLCEIEEIGDIGRQRLEGIELTLDVVQAPEWGSEELLAFLERTRRHCAEVMAGRDELASAAVQFLQAAGLIERVGLSLPVAAAELRSTLEARNVGARWRAVSAAFPSAEEVVELHNRQEAARYSENTAADQRAVVLAAHRLLLHREPDMSPVHAALAVELLSDRSLEKTSTFSLSVDWPATFISALSSDGLSVLMLAIDCNDELVGASSEGGGLALVRPPIGEATFSKRLGAWSSDYPYDYGLINRDDGNLQIYQSMGQLELPIPVAERLLIVAQPAVQQIPFNVALVDGEFAGTSTAIGTVPSLTWFRDVRTRPRLEGARRLAWISCAPASAALGTLEVLYARLAPTFEKHGFETDTSGTIPDDLVGASMAIVTAHGQLTSDRRYIHRIADEQELTESPLVLARALARVELVILFVCSGGRVDRHPFANTTIGLPKMLLDRGCRAVVASPWPLAAVVPGNWLERFLEAWEVGDTVLDANFKANRYVSERLGPEANLCLAMMVYGDVLLTKGGSVASPSIAQPLAN
jgi:hypothetical protein